MVAVEWIVTMREGLSLLKRYPDDVMQVGYETLCMNSQKTLGQIEEFLEFEKGDGQLFRYANATLKSPAVRNAYELNKLIKLIRKPFLKTMSELGYE